MEIEFFRVYIQRGKRSGESVYCVLITAPLALFSRHNTYTDDQLLRCYRDSGNNQWLGALLQRYTGMLLGVGLKYLKDQTIAEDAVQHVFELALTKLPQGEIANFKGWLYVLMRNYCLQYLRDRKLIAGDNVLEQYDGTADTGADVRLLEEQLTHVEDALTEIAEEQRITITLFYLQKHSYEQIIEKTGFTFMQVKSYIQNGKRNLKTILTRRFRNSGNE